MYTEGQKFTRKQLTDLLCKEEIQAGLINEEKPLMMPQILSSRFLAHTELKWEINWNNDSSEAVVRKPF